MLRKLELKSQHGLASDTKCWFVLYSPSPSLRWPCSWKMKHTHSSCLLCAFFCTVVVSGTKITSFPRGSAHHLRDWDWRNEHLFCRSLFSSENMNQKEASLKATLSPFFCNPAVNIFLSFSAGQGVFCSLRDLHMYSYRSIFYIEFKNYMLHHLSNNAIILLYTLHSATSKQ